VAQTQGTLYGGTSLDNCLALGMGQNLNTSFTACATDNCGGPQPTAPVCPTITSAMNCTIGLVGPAAAFQFVSDGAPEFMKLPPFPNGSLAPQVVQVQNSVCFSAAMPCSDLAKLGPEISTACPVNQTVTLYSYLQLTPSNFSSPLSALYQIPDYVSKLPAMFSGVDGGGSSSSSSSNSTDFDLVATMPSGCLPSLILLSQLSPSSLALVCNSSSCNSPNATSFVAAVATLGGYTSLTFGSNEGSAFVAGMAAQLSTTPNAVTITSVSDVVVSTRHLLAAGVAIAFSVQTTVASQAALHAAMAAPLSAAAFQSAGLTAVTSISAIPASATTTAAAPFVLPVSPSPPPPPSPPPSPPKSSSTVGAPLPSTTLTVLLAVLSLVF